MARETENAYLALRIALGLTAFLAGLDKFFNLLADWVGYLSPLAASLLPVSPESFMLAVGVIEMAVGLAILTRWPGIGAYIAAVWLLGIAVNLLLTGRYFDVAVRDVVMAVSAYALARLAGAHEPVRARAGVTERGGEAHGRLPA